MNSRRFTFLAAALLSLVVPGSSGAQTAYGPGGLFIHPSAFVRPAGSTSLNVSWFEQKLPGSRTTSWLPVSVTAGLRGKAEVGAIFVQRLDLSANGSSGGAFVKYQFLPDSMRSPAVAIAASYLGGGIQLSSVSGVASHRFGSDAHAIVAHLGVQWARRADIPINKDDTAVFAGLEIPLARRLSLLCEYGSRFDFDYKERSAIGLVYRGSRGYQVGIAAVNIGRSQDHHFFAGIGFPFGGS